MSTILDALRKVQRERSAQAPPADLRGSVTSETPSPARRRRRRSSGWISALALILAVVAAGSWLYSSGRVDAWLGGPSQEERVPTEAELDALERETREQEAALARADTESGAKEEVTPPTPKPQAPPAETPEIAAERARLEAAIANARAAQEAQREAERAQAEQIQAEERAKAAAATPAPPAPEIQAVAPTPPAAPAKPAPPKAVVAKSARTAPAARPSPRPAEASAPIQSAFPDVAVESIRWHPIPERRVASLRFERQNVPEAHEGDIVAGVQVHRIDPGAVELRVGSAKRTVSPGP